MQWSESKISVRVNQQKPSHVRCGKAEAPPSEMECVLLLHTKWLVEPTDHQSFDIDIVSMPIPLHHPRHER